MNTGMRANSSISKDVSVMNNKACSFIIPCYNESRAVIEKTVQEMKDTLNELKDITYEIIVVNDGMPVENMPRFREECVFSVHHDHNRGYGASLLTGISRSKYEWIGIIDADGTYPIKHFKRFFEYTVDHDMIVGKRRWKDISWIRRLPKFFLLKLASFVTNYAIPDLNSGMRLFKKEIVQKYLRLFPQRFSFTSTITIICITNFYKVCFVDIPYYERIGKSAIHPIRDTVNFFYLVFRMALYFKPLRFFVPLSTIVFLLAVARGVRDVLAVNHFGGLALVLFFMAFQIFFFGLIAEIVSKK